jgi:hypothetical protein
MRNEDITALMVQAKVMHMSVYLQPRHENWQYDSFGITGEETNAEGEGELKLNVSVF